MAPDPREAADDRFAPFGLEGRETRAIDETRNDLARVEGDAIVRADDPVDLARVVKRRLGRLGIEPGGTGSDAWIVANAIAKGPLIQALADLAELAIGLELVVRP